MFEVPLSVEQAMENRDAMVKTIYGFLFQWLVGRINGVLRPREVCPTQSARPRVKKITDVNQNYSAHCVASGRTAARTQRSRSLAFSTSLASRSLSRTAWTRCAR